MDGFKKKFQMQDAGQAPQMLARRMPGTFYKAE
jgi:hypothetical protein